MLYSTLFNNEIKRTIFECDDYTCRICGARGGVLHCHHIDYNKFNTALENLTTLCCECHGKTGAYKNREFWKKFFGHEHKTYCLVIGRFQVPTPHAGHTGIIYELLKEGKNVCVLLREAELDDKNPYGFQERREAFEAIFKNEILEGRLIAMPICDIDAVVYGRGVGYDIRQIELEDSTQKISGTVIRKQHSAPEDVVEKAMREMPEELRDLLNKHGW